MRFGWKQEGAHPGHGKVTLDGYDASNATRGFTVRSSVNDVTTVELDLVVLHGADLDTDAMVLIPAPVAALLVEFGWTPPEGAEVKGGAMRLERREVREPDLLDELPKEGRPVAVLDELERECVCATDPDAPESCYVHGWVSRHP